MEWNLKLKQISQLIRPSLYIKANEIKGKAINLLIFSLSISTLKSI